jgi:hypothetical protein
VNFLVLERGVAGRAGAMRAIAPCMPPHDSPRQSRRRHTAKLCAAGANGINMRQCWSTRRKAMTNDSNSSKVHRREG